MTSNTTATEAAAFEVRPCVDTNGNRTSWDICYPSEPDAAGVGVVASCYGTREQADTMAASLTPATDERIAELLGEIRTDLEMAAKVSLADPGILVELRALCERAGYGNVMSSASALWRERLGDLAGGEFVSGPCRTTVENTIARIDTALANKEQS